MTYQNPVLPGFYPDPSVCRVGDESFMVTADTLVSEMATAPGTLESLPFITREHFNGPAMPAHWVGVRRLPAALSSLTVRPGSLTLHGGEATLDSPEPTFVGRRQQHRHCRARARVEAGLTAEAGISVFLDETACYDIAVRGDRVLARARVGPFDTVVGAAPRPSGPVVLTVETGPHPHGPDRVSLGFDDIRGTTHTVAALDGRYLSSEVTGGFLGRMTGLYAVGGDAAFDWVDYDEA